MLGKNPLRKRQGRRARLLAPGLFRVSDSGRSCRLGCSAAGLTGPKETSGSAEVGAEKGGVCGAADCQRVAGKQARCWEDTGGPWGRNFFPSCSAPHRRAASADKVVRHRLGKRNFASLNKAGKGAELGKRMGGQAGINLAESFYHSTVIHVWSEHTAMATFSSFLMLSFLLKREQCHYVDA